jgi:small subunit ribosomal protein S20
LANHKSAIKRNRQSLERRDRNRAVKTRVKNVVKEVNAAIAQGQAADEVQAVLKSAIPVIQRAGVKGTFHKRAASRKVSRLTKRVNKFVQGLESAA